MVVAVRYVLPIVLVVVGLILIAADSGGTGLDIGLMAIGAGLSVFFFNWLVRLGMGGESEREAEEAARVYFAEHGRWPDDPPR
jgi:ABC-type glycerol-3-phosphate transport system permease component